MGAESEPAGPCFIFELWLILATANNVFLNHTGRTLPQKFDKRASGPHTNTLGWEIKSPIQMTEFWGDDIYLTNYDVPCKLGHLILWSTFVYLEPFFVKSGILRTSVYNVYGSQNEFVDSVTRVFILRIAQSWTEWPSTTGCRICGSEN